MPSEKGQAAPKSRGRKPLGDEAAQALRQKAEMGLAQAAYDLGVCYFTGRNGLETDYKEAAKYWKMAADQGHPAASHNYAILCATGQGVRQSDRQAFKYRKIGANGGLPAAQFDLAVMYHQGCGLKDKDDYLAAYWAEKAAGQGSEGAILYMADAHRKGWGVPQSDALAASWLRLAADRGSQDAQEELDALHKKHVREYQGMFTSAPVLLREAGEGDHVVALFKVGQAYRFGLGLPKSVKAALTWLEEAAKRDFVEAMVALADIYERGEPPVGRDQALALSWRQKAAERCDCDSIYKVFMAYERGDGVPRDAAKAAYWLEKLASQGVAEAYFRLGQVYGAGLGVKEDADKALACFLEAVEGELPEAQCFIGLSYCQRDDDKALQKEGLELLKKAAAQGYAPAQGALDKIKAAGGHISRDVLTHIFEQWLKTLSATMKAIKAKKV